MKNQYENFLMNVKVGKIKINLYFLSQMKNMKIILILP